MWWLVGKVVIVVMKVVVEITVQIVRFGVLIITVLLLSFFFPFRLCGQ